jgi:Asp/Glu/hydantoin racemase
VSVPARRDLAYKLGYYPGVTATGGRNLYGIPVGMLMLRSRFPRIVGDAGNAATWPFPVQYRIVDGTSPGGIVRDLDVAEALPLFLEAAQELEAAGVDVVTTNCGFLILLQQEIQARLGVPFLSSSLLQVPWVQALLPPGSSVGVLTIEAAALSDAHLQAAGIDPGTVTVRGLDGGTFNEQILDDHLELDVDRCRDEHETAARELVAEHPEIGAIVLECTNMPPYADAIREATGLPVYDLTTLVGWAAAAARRRPVSA